MKELKDTNLYIENYDRYVEVTKNGKLNMNSI